MIIKCPDGNYCRVLAVYEWGYTVQPLKWGLVTKYYDYPAPYNVSKVGTYVLSKKDEDFVTFMEFCNEGR
jgi:hypothetical protein